MLAHMHGWEAESGNPICTKPTGQDVCFDMGGVEVFPRCC